MVLYILTGFAAVMAIAAYALLTQPKFGKLPEGERLARISSSPHYVNGEFRNTVPTPPLLDGQSTPKILWDDMFADRPRLRPDRPLPTVKTDLLGLDVNEDILIWLGHSSYYIQLAGQRILVDPVFSGYGAPFSSFNKIFPGTDIYTAADMPEIDYLLITHDHWDHLDYDTVTALMPKVRTAILPLGVGADFQHWGYPAEKLIEADWNTALPLEKGLTIHLAPARHYSGRLLTANKTLWTGYVLETPERRIFLSGDTGYGPHIREIAATFGTFDLVAIDGGQYDPRWPLIHMTPEEAVRAAGELGAHSMVLAHAGRFSIASHPWDEPFIRAAQAVKNTSFPMLTPRIGEPVWLDGREQAFTRWWEAATLSALSDER